MSEPLPGMPAGGKPEPQLDDRSALDQIAAAMRTGDEYDPDLWNVIADLVNKTGRTAYYTAED